MLSGKGKAAGVTYCLPLSPERCARKTTRPGPPASANSAPIRGAQLKALAGRPVSMTPTLAVADLLGCVARFQLAQRVVDRGDGFRNAVVPECLPDLRRSHGGRCHCF